MGKVSLEERVVRLSVGGGIHEKVVMREVTGQKRGVWCVGMREETVVCGESASALLLCA